jgi:SPOR domain
MNSDSALYYLCLRTFNFHLCNKRMQFLVITLVYASILILLPACSASTGTRYESETNSNINGENNSANGNEDFDITPYKTKIEIEEPTTDGKAIDNAWYEFDNQSSDFSNFNRKIIGTTDGYRILVVATDDMDEANSVRADITSKIKRSVVYISFEPPFYKVKVGDFTDLKEINNLKFKLNQLGYTEARVVQETVNLFEE